MKPFAYSTLLILLLLTSCTDPVRDSGESAARQVVLVANEGNFTEGNGSLTWFVPGEETTWQKRFEQVNQRPLGGIIQSITRSDTHLYIVTNSPNKIEKVSLPDMTHEQTLNLDDPAITPVRIVLTEEGHGYVSSLYDHSVYRVNLTTMTLDPDPIATGENPQDLLLSDGNLFVANNGFGNDETLTVIDTETDQATETLTVGPGPLQMELDHSGRLWVLSAGRIAYDENWNRQPENDLPGQIDILDPATMTSVERIELESQAISFALDPRTGYAWILSEEGVLRIGLDTLVLEATNLPARRFESIGVSPWSEQLYLGQSLGFDQSGQVLIASPEGALADSFQTGIAPVQIEFLELD